VVLEEGRKTLVGRGRRGFVLRGVRVRLLLLGRGLRILCRFSNGLM
jgi:hypothetical protein